jgi:hypothetical protein
MGLAGVEVNALQLWLVWSMRSVSQKWPYWNAAPKIEAGFFGRSFPAETMLPQNDTP